MTRLSLAALCALAFSCAQPPLPESLMQGTGDTHGVLGLERVARTGPYEVGAVERFVLHVDPSVIARVDWSATAGSLTASGFNATWTLPDAKTAVLTAKLSRVDGSSGVMTWQLGLAPAMISSNTQTAQAALLAMPMPVFDGGTLDVSGGACEVRYEGTTNNVAIAFTTATHPSLMYGRWNGSTWALEVVDALGFGTGGLVSQHVSMRVEANGTPHLAYVRDNVPFYATKQGGVWLRERVDASLPTNGATGLPSVVLNGSAPVVLYDSFVSGTGTRPVLATRTGANTWSATMLTGSTGFIVGDLAIDGAGRATFPLYTGFTTVQLASVVLPATAMQFVSLFGANTTPPRIDTVSVSNSRMLVRSSNIVSDVAVNATFASSTLAKNPIEVGTADVGDIEWDVVGNRPVVLHQHGTTLELVTPNAAGFWQFTQLGTTSGSTAALAVHPTTGEVSVCFQANNRIMFQ